MKIEDPELLAEFRTAGRCESCTRWCQVREPHHIWARGMGGGGRLDIRFNLIAVGSTIMNACPCHTLIHNGCISRDELLDIVARRERTTPAEIVAEMWRLQRADKDGREIKRKGA